MIWSFAEMVVKSRQLWSFKAKSHRMNPQTIVSAEFLMTALKNIQQFL